MKLHLGCGTRRLENYLNIDERAEVNPDKIADILNLHILDLGSCKVTEIYACHVLEHLEDPAGALQHWRDILSSGGIIRIAVPDIAALFAAYQAGVRLARLSGMIWGGRRFPSDRHRTGWDFEEMAILLRQCGFYDIKRWEPEWIFPRDYDDYSRAAIHTAEDEHIRISLNVEATKP